MDFRQRVLSMDAQQLNDFKESIIVEGARQAREQLSKINSPEEMLEFCQGVAKGMKEICLDVSKPCNNEECDCYGEIVNYKHTCYHDL